MGKRDGNLTVETTPTTSSRVDVRRGLEESGGRLGCRLAGEGGFGRLGLGQHGVEYWPNCG